MTRNLRPQVLLAIPALPPSLRADLVRIAHMERTDISALCQLVLDRLQERHRRHGDVPDLGAALEPALERLVAAYDRHSAGTAEVAMRALR